MEAWILEYGTAIVSVVFLKLSSPEVAADGLLGWPRHPRLRTQGNRWLRSRTPQWPFKGALSWGDPSLECHVGPCSA